MSIPKWSIFTFLFIVLSFALSAQESGTEYRSSHYLIISENGFFEARIYAQQLEALYEYFNSYFHFPDPSDDFPLRVRIFAEKKSYDQYLTSIIQSTHNGFLYLHYGRSQKNELLGYSSEDSAVQLSLTRQAFLQFLRSSIPNPPAWLTKGFSVYLENVRFDVSDQTVVFSESNVRAETLQILLERSQGTLPTTIREFIALDNDRMNAGGTELSALAWGLISFLLNTPNNLYNRALWDSISHLDDETSTRENTLALIDHVFSWIDMLAMERDLVSYIRGLQTFRTLLSEGKDLLTKKMYVEADDIFAQAMEMKPSNYSVYYYRGLINYEQGNYSLAITFYEAALDRNLDDDLAFLALGLSYHSNGAVKEGISYLEDISPSSQYFDRAQRLLSQWRRN